MIIGDFLSWDLHSFIGDNESSDRCSTGEDRMAISSHLAQCTCDIYICPFLNHRSCECRTHASSVTTWSGMFKKTMLASWKPQLSSKRKTSYLQLQKELAGVQGIAPCIFLFYWMQLTKRFPPDILETNINKAVDARPAQSGEKP